MPRKRVEWWALWLRGDNVRRLLEAVCPVCHAASGAQCSPQLHVGRIKACTTEFEERRCKAEADRINAMSDEEYAEDVRRHVEGIDLLDDLP